MERFDIRNDVYQRPLVTALERIGVGLGWRSADVGAGSGDISIALANLVGWEGRVYTIDSDPLSRDVVAAQAAAQRSGQVIAITQDAEDLLLPELVDLAFCRFLLMHVHEPVNVLRTMAEAVRSGGFIVAQEPVTSAGRIGGLPFSMPSARNAEIGAMLPAIARVAGIELIDCWAEAPAGIGPGPISTYLSSLTGVDPGNDPVILPPLVTVVGRRTR